MPRRAINKDGLDLIKRWEGCKLTAYICPAGVLTIGYGSTGSHVKKGMTITQEQAEELLRSDLRRFEDGVAKLAPIATENQYSAMVSFAFNVGLANFEESTLLRLHRDGKYWAAQNQFGKWIYAKKKALPGLVKRRAEEAALYGAK